MGFPYPDTEPKNLVDLCESALKMRTLSNDEIMAEWPKVYSSNLNSHEIIEMYRRFSEEALEVLGRYEALTQFTP